MRNGQAGRLRYDNLKNYKSLESLIDEAESEDLFYECKSPAVPKVSQDTKVQLAKALSGFSNTEGGVLIYGIETQKHKGSSDDIMVQIASIGNIAMFAKLISNIIPTLTMPSVTNFEYQVIKRKPSDTKGVVVIYVPPCSRPVQSLSDKKFWFRGGDQFVEAPYTVIERLFAATDVPDISVIVEQHDPIDQATQKHVLSLVLSNSSSAAGRDIMATFEIMNPDDTSLVESSSMKDASSINGKRKIYTQEVKSVLHDGLNTVVGSLVVRMKPRKKKLVLRVEIFADKMSARKYEIRCYLTASSFKTGPIVRLK